MMKRSLWLYCLLIIIFLIPLYINVSLLHSQCDPFISTTIISGKCIGAFGSIDGAVDYICQISEFGAWQSHTRDFLIYEPFSGLLTYIISAVTGMPLIDVCYLPVPYIICFLLLFCILKLIYTSSINYFDISSKTWKAYIAVILFGSFYTFIGMNVIGKFYVLEYHGINFVLALCIYYLLIKSIMKSNKVFSSKVFLALFPLFLANMFVHYTFPLTITGGLILYLTIYEILRHLRIVPNNEILPQLTRLTLIFVILLSFQDFYYIRLSHAGNMMDMLNDLIATITTRLFYSGSSGRITNAIYPFVEYYLLIKRFWHMLLLIIITSITPLTIYYLKKRDISKNSLLLFSYIIILGMNVLGMYSYFVHYAGYLALELKEVWLLNALILFPILLFTNSHHKLWKKMGLILAIGLLLSTILLIGWATFEVDICANGYNAFPYSIKEDGKNAYAFAISHSDTSTVISGSIQATSGLYEHLYYYDLDKLNKIYPKIALYYMINMTNESRKHKDVLDIYNSLKNGGVSNFILTNYEMKNGFYGGLTVAPLDKNETKIFQDVLENNENVIYDSKKARLYKFRE